MPTPLNVALVGYGFGGRSFHAPLIEACADLHLHTVVTTRPEALAADSRTARAVATLEQALADPDIALVVISTPNTLHAPQAEAALRAGKAVVVDKPFTVTLAEAERVAALADREGRFLSVFHNRRWDADFLTLKRMIAEGRLGRIGLMESRFDRFRTEVWDRWRERDEPGAGLWHDLGPHLIDQALVLFGMPQGVTADLAVMRDGGQTIDYAHVVLRYERLRVVLHADMLTPQPGVRFVVHGDRAVWTKSGFDTQESRTSAGQAPGGPGWRDAAEDMGEIVEGLSREREPVTGEPGDYPAYYDAVARAIRGGGRNPVPPSEALAVMRVLEAAIESSRTRAEIAPG